jgi:hypothetical protein
MSMKATADAMIEAAKKRGFESQYDGDEEGGMLKLLDAKGDHILMARLSGNPIAGTEPFQLMKKVEGPEVMANYGVESKIVSAEFPTADRLIDMWDASVRDHAKAHPAVEKQLTTELSPSAPQVTPSVQPTQQVREITMTTPDQTTPSPTNVVQFAAAPVEPASPAGDPMDARAQALEAIKQKIAEGSDPDTGNKAVLSINNSGVDPKIDNPKELLEAYMKSSDFETEHPGFKKIIESAHRQFAGPANKADEKGPAAKDDQQAIIDAANQKKTDPEGPDAGKDAMGKAPFTDMQKLQEPREVTAAAVAMGYLGKAISSAFGSKNKDAGPSFQALQAGGEGLGMNNPNQDPTRLADIAMDRYAKSAEAVANLKADADPAAAAKIKADFLDSAGDAQRHIGNEHRSMLSQMAEGKKHEFDASDTIKARSDKFNEAMKKVEGSEAAAGDPDFQTKAKEAGEKLAEQIKQLMESIKEMAKKLMSMGNDKTSGPSAPAPGR